MPLNRIIIVGLGVQGAKRCRIAGADVVATIDPINPIADYHNIDQVPVDQYDAALICTPDGAKFELLNKLIDDKKHILVEKPLICNNPDQLSKLSEKAKQSDVVCYTAYNHRFEPHFVKMRDIIQGDALGKIYSIRMFYGNGTAQIVRESQWRDKAAGVLTDLGSHLLDTVRFWLGDDWNDPLDVRGAFSHENKSMDHVIIGANGSTAVQLEMMLLSWRNYFSADVYGANGSAHITSLCKWGPSEFIHRSRVKPSGRPTEESIVLVQDDPTWQHEYDHFINLIANNGQGNLDGDIWLNTTLQSLARSVGVTSIVSNKVND